MSLISFSFLGSSHGQGQLDNVPELYLSSPSLGTYEVHFVSLHYIFSNSGRSRTALKKRGRGEERRAKNSRLSGLILRVRASPLDLRLRDSLTQNDDFVDLRWYSRSNLLLSFSDLSQFREVKTSHRFPLGRNVSFISFHSFISERSFIPFCFVVCWRLVKQCARCAPKLWPPQTWNWSRTLHNIWRRRIKIRIRTKAIVL